MNDEFDALVQEAFHTLIRFRPDMGTMLGLHQYDTEMPPGSKDTLFVFAKEMSQYLQKFESIEREALSGEKQIDTDLMISILKFHQFRIMDLRQWERDPDCAAVIGYAIVPLFSREFAPFETRVQSITARLQKVPQFIREFKTRIKTPTKLWTEMAKEACSVLPMFFKIVTDAAAQKGLDTDQLEEASADTADALFEYLQWLDTVSCGGEPILGREQFENLLRIRELGLTAEEILEIGQTYLQKEKARLEKLTSKIDPSLTANEVITNIRSQHPPSFEAVIKEYEKAIAKVKSLVHQNDFSSFPEGERLIVQKTPYFMRHIVPIAAYFPPAPLEEDQMGIYFVTPGEEDALAEHNYSSIVNTSVHEAYPGHHLQLTWANQNSSLVRVLSHAPEFIEGWAHYCEERMQDYGLKDVTHQIMQTRDIIFRAVRIIIDVRLHCGEMTFEQAISFLESETKMQYATALAEVKRYTKTPAQPLSYLLGKHLLLKMQKEVQIHMKETYSEKMFHDVLLKAGSVPFRFLRAELELKNML